MHFFVMLFIGTGCITDKDYERWIAEIDPDGDGVVTEDDNCPDIANADQTDADGDDIGDACEDTGTS